MDQWPLSSSILIGTINKCLNVTREEVKLYGPDIALEMHCERSNVWIQSHQIIPPTTKEEEVAVIGFAAALQVINLLFATGEVMNGE